MRPASDAVWTSLQTQTASEPIIILGIHWLGQNYWFASKAVNGARPTLVSVGPCVNQKQHDSRCNTSSMAVTLDDNDGTLKGIIDVIIAEKAPCSVYLGFEGLTFEQSLLILNGKILGPVQWSEGDRMLTMTLESQIDAPDAGFAPTDEFTDLSPEAIGVPWPMVFGKVAHSPCIKIRRQKEGFLKTPVRISSQIYRTRPDGQGFILDDNIKTFSYFGDTETQDKIYIRGGDEFEQGKEIKIIIDRVIFKGKFAGEVFSVTQANCPLVENVTFENYTGTVLEAKVPVGTPNLAGCYIYLKSSSGVWAGFVVHHEGQLLTFKDYFVNPQTKQQETIKSPRILEAAFPIAKNGLIGIAAATLHHLMLSIAFGALNIGGKDRYGVLRDMVDLCRTNKNDFWQAPADTSVRLFGDDPDIYIASCVELASIDAVYGHKSVTFADGKSHKMLAPIPKSYYTKQLRSSYPVNGAYTSGLIFAQPLSSYEREGWSDNVYVTATSTVGPNVADVITYIIETYVPSLNPVDRTFANVRNKTDPVNFVLTQRKNALDLAAEIAWQTRCAIRVDSRNVELLFLDESPTSRLSLIESNTLRDSISLTFTETSRIKTKLVSKWATTNRDKLPPVDLNNLKDIKLVEIIKSLVDSDNPKKNDTRVSVYRENIDRYGEIAQEAEIYVFNEEQYILKTLNFWGHRFANSWRLVELTTFMNGSRLQAFDGVTLAYSNAAIANLNAMPAVVESSAIDFQNRQVKLRLWLPSLAGRISIDSRAWSS